MKYYIGPASSDELYHHGVKGMRWGVRKDKRHTVTLGGRKVPVGRVREMVDYSPEVVAKNYRPKQKDPTRFVKRMLMSQIPLSHLYIASGETAHHRAVENGRLFMETVNMQNMQFQNQQFMNTHNTWAMNSMMGF